MEHLNLIPYLIVAGILYSLIMASIGEPLAIEECRSEAEEDYEILNDIYDPDISPDKVVSWGVRAVKPLLEMLQSSSDMMYSCTQLRGVRAAGFLFHEKDIPIIEKHSSKHPEECHLAIKRIRLRAKVSNQQ